MVIYLHLKLSLPPFFNFSSFKPLFMFNAIFLGILFGFMGCPVCLVPLSLSLSVYYHRPEKTLIPVLIFNLFRLLSVFLCSLGITLSISLIKTFLLPRYMLILDGLIMIIFSFIVVRGIHLRSYETLLKRIKIKKIYFLYGFWGLTVGFFCGMEATGFLVYLNSYSTNILLRIVSLFLFSIFSVLPITLFIFLLYKGLKKLSAFWVDFSIYLKNLSFFYLFLMGVTLIFLSLFR